MNTRVTRGISPSRMFSLVLGLWRSVPTANTSTSAHWLFKSIFHRALLGLQLRRDSLSRLFRCDDKMYLEICEVLPVRHPLIEQPAIISFHELVAALELFVDPA